MIALCYLSILNIIDGTLSYVGLQHRFINEANPVMKILYDYHPILFVSIKITFSLLLMCLIYLKKIPRNGLMKALTYIAVSLYTYVFMIHTIWLTNIM